MFRCIAGDSRRCFAALALYFRESLSRQKTEDEGPKAELTEQRTEERSRRAEDRGLMTEVRIETVK